MARRMVAALALTAAVFAAVPAAAAPCDRWAAGIEDVEGGRAMVARVCGAGSIRPAVLTLMCGARVVLQLDDGMMSEPPGGDLEFHAPYRFTIDGAAMRVELGYQAMDGLMMLDLAPRDPLLEAIRKGKHLTIRSEAPGDAAGALDFTLSGAARAVQAVTASCRQ